MSPTIQRQCRGNRYCSFVGPFYPQRLFFLASERPVVVGACWAESFERPEEPKRFVCNRCAHRTLEYDSGIDHTRRVWLLRCPHEGEPLGRAAESLVLDGEGRVVGRFAGRPEPRDFAALLATLFPSQPVGLPSLHDLAGVAIDLFKREDYAGALIVSQRISEMEPDNRQAWNIRYRCLEKLGRTDEAQEALGRVLTR